MMFTGGRASHSKKRNPSGSGSGRKSSLDHKNPQPRMGPEGYTYRLIYLFINLFY